MTTIDRETFYMGVLLGLKPAKPFAADEGALRGPFVAALRAAINGGDVRIDGIDAGVIDDPPRQTRFVIELMAFGQSARLLSLLNPDLERAQARPAPEGYRDAFGAELGMAEWFHRIGDAFAHDLTPA